MIDALNACPATPHIRKERSCFLQCGTSILDSLLSDMSFMAEGESPFVSPFQSTRSGTSITQQSFSPHTPGCKEIHSSVYVKTDGLEHIEESELGEEWRQCLHPGSLA